MLPFISHFSILSKIFLFATQDLIIFFIEHKNKYLKIMKAVRDHNHGTSKESNAVP